MTKPSLDVSVLVRGTYRAVFSDPKRFLDIAWPWLGLSVLAVYGVERLAPTPADIEAGQADHGLSLVQFLLSLVNLTAMCAFLCKWTRWLVLNEQPEGADVIGFKRREVRVLLVTFAAGLIVGLPLALAFVLPFMFFLSSESPPAYAVLILAAILPAGIFVWLRLSLAPALAALDVPANAIKAAWAVSARNAGKLFALVLACVVPMFLGQMALMQILIAILGGEESARPGSPEQGVVILLAVLFGFVMMALVVSAQALAAGALMAASDTDR